MKPNPEQRMEEDSYPDPPLLETARWVAQEYANDLREVVKKLLKFLD
jgi:hypothetical protein